MNDLTASGLDDSAMLREGSIAHTPFTFPWKRTEHEEPPRIEGFICMTREMTWGWGPTADEAIKRARKAGGGRGARKGERLVVELPPGSYDAFVDQMGRIVWDWAPEADKTLSTFLIEEPTEDRRR